jgi:hypothetical protein
MEKDVPYIVYESEAARHERTVKRLIVALIVTICLLVASNMAWLYVFNQYDFTSTTTEITTDEGNTNLLEAGNDGEINNGNTGSEEVEDSNEAE